MWYRGKLVLGSVEFFEFCERSDGVGQGCKGIIRDVEYDEGCEVSDFRGQFCKTTTAKC
jgi:hypothetical protein